MSSILKALKKLEQERHRETARTSPLPLDNAILHELRAEQQRRPPSTGLLISAALALFLGGAGLVYLLQRPSPPTGSPQPAPPAAAPVPSPLPAPTPKAGIPPTAPPTGIPKNAGSEKPAERRQQAPAPPKTAPVTVQASTAPAAATPSQASTQNTRRPHLKVLGIAYQAGDNTSPVAIVNGTPVTAGSMIEGVRVEEILKDRVRFSQAGERFEVPLAR